MTTNSLSNLQLPQTFRELQNIVNPGYGISIGQQSDFENLQGIVSESPLASLEKAYILKLQATDGDTFVEVCYMIGTKEGTYHHTSMIRILDLEQKKFITRSGNVYCYEELLTSEPDEYVLEICATLNSWGMSRRFGTPPIFF